MRKAPKFSPEVIERAVRMVVDVEDQHPSQCGDRVDLGQDRLHGRNAAQVGAPGRKPQRAVVAGHSRYFAVPCNGARVQVFRFQVARLWHRIATIRSGRTRTVHLRLAAELNPPPPATHREALPAAS